MSTVTTDTIETKVPARLDRLPWSRFHWRVIIGLGTVWILDGLEVTMVGSVASRLTEDGSGIAISAGQIGTAAAFYVAGACSGALFFGQLTDRFGRKKLFLLTLLVYIASTVATAFAFAPWYFFLARFLTGAGIGGEYAAINSAIDELIPARVRGRVDLMINGSYWAGAAAGAIAALFFLNTSIFAADLGWRLAFGVGAVLGLTILLVRRHVPESPRWLFIHGREEEAERIVESIESEVRDETGVDLEEPGESLTVRQRKTIPFRTIGRTAFKLYPRRAVLGLALFVGQAFIYNAITFDLGTLLSTFFDVGSGSVPFYIALFGVGNLLGPLLLGRLFDTVGRKPMITLSYVGSAAVSVVLTLLFVGGSLTAWTFLLLLIATFFLASAGASAAYLTVSEIFPMETRALAIAFFYAVGTAVGGITGPLLFGHLIGSGERGQVAIGFFIGAGVMALGGLAELFFGVKAEQQSLESIAQPLTAAEAEEDGEPGEGEQEQREQEEDEPPSAALACRARAAEERARAAEHRATVQEARAEDDDEGRGRAEVEQSLADIADLRARAFDEQATEQEEREDADRAGGDGDGDRRAATERAEAAAERARSYFEQAEALGAEASGEERQHAALARAAEERARAREQRALAAEAWGVEGDGEPAQDEAEARAARHEAWAELHEARGRIHEADAYRDTDAREAERRWAGALESRALSAEEQLAAAEQRREAAALSAERDSTEATRRRRHAAAERDDRLRRRLERRRAHRYRLGPGSYSVSRGMPVGATPAGADDVDREIDALARAVEEHGEIGRRDLSRRVGARYWGPGRFGRALREAVDEGRVRRVSRSVYGPVQD